MGISRSALNAQLFKPFSQIYSKCCPRVLWPRRRTLEDRSANRSVAHLHLSFLVYYFPFVVLPFFDPIANCILMHHDGLLLNNYLQTHAPDSLVTYFNPRHFSDIPRKFLGVPKKKMQPFYSHYRPSMLEHLVFINPQPHLELRLGTVQCLVCDCLDSVVAMVFGYTFLSTPSSHYGYQITSDLDCRTTASRILVRAILLDNGSAH